MTENKKYQFIRLIFSGKTSDIYLCREIMSDGRGRVVALKMLKSDWRAHKDLILRIRDEARLLSLTRHRNIINVFDITGINDRTTIVMEYLPAVDLRLVIQKMLSLRKRIPLRVCLEIIASIASALDAAYNKPPEPGLTPLRVLHRNIRPSKIMIDAEGVVKLIDFGGLDATLENRESQTREIQYEPAEYLAPERLFFAPETSSSDVYSLGATLFEACSAKPFGQAFAQKDQHQQMMHQKVDKLIQVLRLTLPVAHELSSIFRRVLSYESAERLSAIEFSQRARTLARSCAGPSLVTWAERAIPYFIETKEENALDINSLNGTVHSEDSTMIAMRIAKNSNKEEFDQSSIRRGAIAQMRSPEDDMGTDVYIKEENLSEPAPILSAFVEFDESINQEDRLPPPPPLVPDEETAEIIPMEATTGNAESPVEISGTGDYSEPTAKNFVAKPTPFSTNTVPKKDKPKSRRLTIVFVAVLLSLGLVGGIAAITFRYLESQDGSKSVTVTQAKPSERKDRSSSSSSFEEPERVEREQTFKGSNRESQDGSKVVTMRETKPSEEDRPSQSSSSVDDVKPSQEKNKDSKPALTGSDLVAQNVIYIVSTPDTTKLTIRCDDGVKAQGVDSVTISGKAVTNCKVKAMLRDRSRKMSNIKKASAGRYTCFQDDKGSCSREK